MSTCRTRYPSITHCLHRAVCVCVCRDYIYLSLGHFVFWHFIFGYTSFIVVYYTSIRRVSHLCLDKFHSLLFIILRYFVFWRFMFGHTSFLVDIAINFGTSRSETSYLDRLHSLFFILRSFFIFLHFIFGYISFLVGIN